MKVIIVPSLAEPVGNVWKNLQAKYTKKGNFYISSPLSSTPLPVYEWVIANCKFFKNWHKVKFVLMDEMLEDNRSPFKYVPLDDPASYEGFARKNLLEPLAKKVAVFYSLFHLKIHLGAYYARLLMEEKYGNRKGFPVFRILSSTTPFT